MEWQTSKRTIPFGDRPLIMGIVNLTPDSFSDGGKLLAPALAATRALELEREGADIIDLGAESTRPGAAAVPGEEEAKRLYPVLERLRGALQVPISVDTTKASVALGAMDRGAEIINDVSGGRADPMMWDAVMVTGAGYVLTHSRGTPSTMHSLTDYGEAGVFGTVAKELKEAHAGAVAAGIAPEKIVFDPGIGFAKTMEQNVTLLAALGKLAAAAGARKRPIVAGVSRKSFLTRIAGDSQLPTMTAVSETYAALRGAQVIRTHDVAAARAMALFVERAVRADAGFPVAHSAPASP